MYFSSCTNNDVTTFEEEEGPAIVNEITVAKGTRVNNVSDEEEILTDKNRFDENSILYISQQGTELAPGFGQSSSTTRCPVYQYQWYENPDATWAEEYNFRCVQGKSPMDWSEIKGYGNVGNSFILYALYFPQDQEVRFSVESDQSLLQNFLKSDIMGAYHATSALYTRPRFRLFHLMVYLRVTLYVPVFDGKTSEDYNDQQYSGFLEGAMKEAVVRNAYTAFDIEWKANRSSDTDAPLTQFKKDQQTNIRMFCHESDDHESDEEPITLENIKSFYKDSPIGEDQVRKYEFSVLFPTQTFGDKFLYFELQAPGSQASKYYYFSPSSQIVGESGNYGLLQGTLQHLYLYLPRTTNETILVGAKILPWNNAVTDMTVTKDPDPETTN